MSLLSGYNPFAECLNKCWSTSIEGLSNIVCIRDVLQCEYNYGNLDI